MTFEQTDTNASQSQETLAKLNNLLSNTSLLTHKLEKTETGEQEIEKTIASLTNEDLDTFQHTINEKKVIINKGKSMETILRMWHKVNKEKEKRLDRMLASTDS